MRAKICRDVDLEMLDRAIAQFEKENFPYCEKNRYNYIIMSKSTRQALCEYNREVNYSFACSSDKVICSYKNNKIAIDDSIPYGEVEIR